MLALVDLCDYTPLHHQRNGETKMFKIEYLAQDGNKQTWFKQFRTEGEAMAIVDKYLRGYTWLVVAA